MEYSGKPYNLARIFWWFCFFAAIGLFSFVMVIAVALNKLAGML